MVIWAGFNTQPPEGGWLPYIADSSASACFNTQPPEGGWANNRTACHTAYIVSTHSRPKAAGYIYQARMLSYQYSFNTQPPEGGWKTIKADMIMNPRFQHTAARRRLALAFRRLAWWRGFQHTAARRRLGLANDLSDAINAFQHTAARRRLGHNTHGL